MIQRVRCQATSWGVAKRPMRGLAACGDAVLAQILPNRQLFVLADALGHGPDAARSADIVAGVVRGTTTAPLRELFAALGRALRGKRGAVVGAVDVSEGRVTYAGVGNVELYGPADVSRPAAAAGMLGVPPLRFREQPLPVKSGERWVLASDGLRAREMRAALDETAGLAATAAAQKLIELAGCDDDDASSIVIDFGAPS